MPAHIWTYLHRDDGSVIASTSCEWSPGGKWGWIARSFADDFGCMPDEVSILETENGDLITVKGEPVGYVIDELRQARQAYAEAAE
jgi:hypothetical protein